jgi:protocatechuate 3,4-dioxygenase, beta subunit
MHQPQSSTPHTTRRKAIVITAHRAALVALPALLPSWGRAQSELRLTPSQSEGPFYPDQQLQDADADLLRNGVQNYSKGDAAWVRGVVTDVQGKPVSGAVVEIWQCDHEGVYRHSRSSGSAPMAFQGFGRIQAGSDGRYTFRTIKPVAYPGRPPHIHFKVKLGNRELLTTQMYVAGEKSNSRDLLTRTLSETQRAQLEAAFVAGSDGLAAQFPIVVKT